MPRPNRRNSGGKGAHKSRRQATSSVKATRSSLLQRAKNFIKRNNINKPVKDKPIHELPKGNTHQIISATKQLSDPRDRTNKHVYEGRTVSSALKSRNVQSHYDKTRRTTQRYLGDNYAVTNTSDPRQRTNKIDKPNYVRYDNERATAFQQNYSQQYISRSYKVDSNSPLNPFRAKGDLTNVTGRMFDDLQLRGALDAVRDASNDPDVMKDTKKYSLGVEEQKKLIDAGNDIFLGIGGLGGKYEKYNPLAWILDGFEENKDYYVDSKGNIVFINSEYYDEYSSRTKEYNKYNEDWLRWVNTFDPERNDVVKVQKYLMEAPPPPWLPHDPEVLAAWKYYNAYSNESSKAAVDAFNDASDGTPVKANNRSYESAFSATHDKSKIDSTFDIIIQSKNITDYYKNTKNYVRDYYLKPIKAGKYGVVVGNSFWNLMDTLDFAARGVRALAAGRDIVGGSTETGRYFEGQDTWWATIDGYSDEEVHKAQEIFMQNGGKELFSTGLYGGKRKQDDIARIKKALADAGISVSFDEIYSAIQEGYYDNPRIKETLKNGLANIKQAYSDPAATFDPDSGDAVTDLMAGMITDPGLVVGGAAKAISYGAVKGAAKQAVKRGLSAAIKNPDDLAKFVNNKQMRAALNKFVNNSSGKNIIFKDVNKFSDDINKLVGRIKEIDATALPTKHYETVFRNTLKQELMDANLSVNAKVVASTVRSRKILDSNLYKAAYYADKAIDGIDFVLIKSSFAAPWAMAKGLKLGGTGIGALRANKMMVLDKQNTLNEILDPVTKQVRLTNLPKLAENYEAGIHSREAFNAAFEYVMKSVDNITTRLDDFDGTDGEGLLYLYDEIGELTEGKCKTIDDLRNWISTLDMRDTVDLEGVVMRLDNAYKRLSDRIWYNSYAVMDDFLYKVSKTTTKDELYDLLRAHTGDRFMAGDVVEKVVSRVDSSNYKITENEIYEMYSKIENGITSTRTVDKAHVKGAVDAVKATVDEVKERLVDYKTFSKALDELVISAKTDQFGDGITPFDKLIVNWKKNEEIKWSAKDLIDKIDDQIRLEMNAYLRNKEIPTSAAAITASEKISALNKLKERVSGADLVSVGPNDTVLLPHMDKMAMYNNFMNDIRIRNLHNELYEKVVYPLLDMINFQSEEAEGISPLVQSLLELSKIHYGWKRTETFLQDIKASLGFSDNKLYACMHELFNNFGFHGKISDLDLDPYILRKQLNNKLRAEFGDSSYSMPQIMKTLESIDADTPSGFVKPYAYEIRGNSKYYEFYKSIIEADEMDLEAGVKKQMLMILMMGKTDDGAKVITDLNNKAASGRTPILYHIDTTGLNSEINSITSISYRKWVPVENIDKLDFGQIKQIIESQETGVLRRGLSEDELNSISEGVLRKVVKSGYTKEEKLAKYATQYAVSETNPLKSEQELLDEFIGFIGQNTKRVKTNGNYVFKHPALVTHDLDGFNTRFLNKRISNIAEVTNADNFVKYSYDLADEMDTYSINTYREYTRNTGERAFTNEEIDRLSKLLYNYIDDIKANANVDFDFMNFRKPQQIIQEVYERAQLRVQTEGATSIDSQFLKAFDEAGGQAVLDEYGQALSEVSELAIYPRQLVMINREAKENAMTVARRANNRSVINFDSRIHMETVSSVFKINYEDGVANMSVERLKSMHDFAKRIENARGRLTSAAADRLEPMKQQCDTFLNYVIDMAKANSWNTTELAHFCDLKVPDNAVDSYLMAQQIWDDYFKYMLDDSYLVSYRTEGKELDLLKHKVNSLGHEIGFDTPEFKLAQKEFNDKLVDFKNNFRKRMFIELMAGDSFNPGFRDEINRLIDENVEEGAAFFRVLSTGGDKDLNLTLADIGMPGAKPTHAIMKDFKKRAIEKFAYLKGLSRQEYAAFKENAGIKGNHMHQMWDRYVNFKNKLWYDFSLEKSRIWDKCNKIVDDLWQHYHTTKDRLESLKNDFWGEHNRLHDDFNVEMMNNTLRYEATKAQVDNYYKVMRILNKKGSVNKYLDSINGFPNLLDEDYLLVNEVLNSIPSNLVEKYDLYNNTRKLKIVLGRMIKKEWDAFFSEPTTAQLFQILQGDLERVDRRYLSELRDTAKYVTEDGKVIDPLEDYAKWQRLLQSEYKRVMQSMSYYQYKIEAAKKQLKKVRKYDEEAYQEALKELDKAKKEYDRVFKEAIKPYNAIKRMFNKTYTWHYHNTLNKLRTDTSKLADANREFARKECDRLYYQNVKKCDDYFEYTQKLTDNEAISIRTEGIKTAYTNRVRKEEYQKEIDFEYMLAQKESDETYAQACILYRQYEEEQMLRMDQAIDGYDKHSLNLYTVDDSFLKRKDILDAEQREIEKNIELQQYKVNETRNRISDLYSERKEELDLAYADRHEAFKAVNKDFYSSRDLFPLPEEEVYELRVKYIEEQYDKEIKKAERRLVREERKLNKLRNTGFDDFDAKKQMMVEYYEGKYSDLFDVLEGADRPNLYKSAANTDYERKLMSTFNGVLSEKIDKGRKIRNAESTIKNRIHQLSVIDDTYAVNGIRTTSDRFTGAACRKLSQMFDMIKRHKLAERETFHIFNSEVTRLHNLSVQRYRMDSIKVGKEFDRTALLSELASNGFNLAVFDSIYYDPKEFKELEAFVKKLQNNGDDFISVYSDHKSGLLYIYLNKKGVLRSNDGKTFMINNEEFIRPAHKRVALPTFDSMKKLTDIPDINDFRAYYAHANSCYADTSLLSFGACNGTTGRLVTRQQAEDFLSSLPAEMDDLLSPKGLLISDINRDAVYDPGFVNAESPDFLTDLLDTYNRQVDIAKEDCLIIHEIFGSDGIKFNDFTNHFTDKELMEYFGDNAEYVVATLVPDKHTRTGLRIEQIRLDSKTGLEAAKTLEHTALLPYDMYYEVADFMNRTADESFAKRLMGKYLWVYKAFALISPGTWMRNFLDATLKASIDDGRDPLNTGNMLMYESASIRWLYTFSKIAKTDPNLLSKANWSTIQKSFKTDMSFEDFELLRGVLDSTRYTTADRYFLDSTAARRGGMDIISGENIGLRNLDEVSLREAYTKYLSKEVNLPLSQQEFMDIYLHKVKPDVDTMDKFEDMMRVFSYNLRTGDVTSIYEKTVDNMFKPFATVENAVRFAQALYLRDLGYSSNQTLRHIHNTQFFTAPTWGAFNKLETIMPFITYRYNNAMYWIRMMDENPRFFKYFEQIYGTISDETIEDLIEQDADSEFTSDNCLKTGGIPLGNTNAYLKVDPTLIGAMNDFMGGPNILFGSGVQGGLNPLLKETLRFSMYGLGFNSSKFMKGVDLNVRKNIVQELVSVIPGGTRALQVYDFLKKDLPDSIDPEKGIDMNTIFRCLNFLSVVGIRGQYENGSVTDYNLFQADLAKQGLWYDSNSGELIPLEYANEYGANFKFNTFEDVQAYMMTHFGKMWDANQHKFVLPEDYIEGGKNQFFDFENDPEAWDKLQAHMKKYYGKVYDYNFRKFVLESELSKGGLNDPDISWKKKCELMYEKFGLRWDSNQSAFVEEDEYMEGGLNQEFTMPQDFGKIKALRYALFGEEYRKDENGKGYFEKTTDPKVAYVGRTAKDDNYENYFSQLGIVRLPAAGGKLHIDSDGMLVTEDGKYVLTNFSEYNKVLFNKLENKFAVPYGRRTYNRRWRSYSNWKRYSYDKTRLVSVPKTPKAHRLAFKPSRPEHRIKKPYYKDRFYTGFGWNDKDAYYRLNYSFNYQYHNPQPASALHRLFAPRINYPYGNGMSKFSFHMR